MAWRNVWRNRRRSLVTISATAFALMVMISYSGLVAGYIAAMQRNLLDFEMGDVQIFAAEYRDKPSIYEKIERPEELLAALDKEGYPACSRLLATALAAAGDASAGVTMRGIDVERDAKVSRVFEKVAKGKWLAKGDDKGVVIGKRLARTLSIGPGAELVVLTQASDGSTANELYKVVGVLSSVGGGADRAIFMSAKAFRELMVMPTGAHQIILRRAPNRDLATAATAVRSIAKGHDVKTWRELVPTLSSMLDSARAAVMTMSLIVYIAIGILILNAMLMAVFERIRELGVLKALGFGPGAVMRLVFLESGIQTAIAVAVGAVLAIPILYYLSTVGIETGRLTGMSIAGATIDTTWKAMISVDTFTMPIKTLVIIVFIAVLYPAIKAARLRPVEAMQHH